MSRELDPEGYCLVCGPNNPVGLAAVVRREGGESEAHIRGAKHHAGFPGIFHGGMVAALLDEAMWYALESQGFLGVTGELTVRYRRPVPLEEELTVRGRVASRRGRMAQAAAQLSDLQGRVLAEAEGKFVERPLAPRPANIRS